MYVLSCVRPRAELTSRTIRSGGWKDEPLGAPPLTSEAKENLRSIVLKGPFEPAKLRVLPSRGLSRNGVKNYSKGPCVTILE